MIWVECTGAPGRKTEEEEEEIKRWTGLSIFNGDYFFAVIPTRGAKAAGMESNTAGA